MIADSVYSFTLALSMIALGLSVVLRLDARRRRRTEPSRSASRAAAASLGLVGMSTLVHFAFGHRPGSVNALGALELIREHPANAAVALLAAGLLATGYRSRQRSSIS